MRKQRYQPEKTAARKLLDREIAKGKIEPPRNFLCWICGRGRWEYPGIVIIYHHVDYTKPFEVFPLCRSCHIRWHIAMGDYPYGKSSRYKDWTYDQL